MTADSNAEPRILTIEANSFVLSSEKDMLDLIGEAMGEGVRVIAVPVEAVAPEFFQLRTGVAGKCAQKAANYRMTLAVVGDVSGYVAESDAFRDLVIEAEHGGPLIFAADHEALEEALARRGIA